MFCGTIRFCDNVHPMLHTGVHAAHVEIVVLFTGVTCQRRLIDGITQLNEIITVRYGKPLDMLFAVLIRICCNYPFSIVKKFVTNGFTTLIEDEIFDKSYSTENITGCINKKCLSRTVWVKNKIFSVKIL